MKTRYILGLVLLFSMYFCYAQFSDDMEWIVGDCPSHWYGNPPESCPLVVTSMARSGKQSGLIPNDNVTDVLLDLGSKIFGEWALEFWMYVPSNKEAYFNLQGEVPITTGELIVGNFFFNQDTANPGVGSIDDTVMGEVLFNFPHDQWFSVIMSFDLTSGMANATWQLWINEIEVIQNGTPFNNQAGDIPTSLGGIDFFSISSNNEYFIDDFCYADSGFCSIAGVQDFSNLLFSVFPSPAQNTIHINTREDIIRIIIYSQLGQKILVQNSNTKIDVSHLSSGLYFVELETETGKGIQKFIKY